MIEWKQLSNDVRSNSGFDYKSNVKLTNSCVGKQEEFCLYKSVIEGRDTNASDDAFDVAILLFHGAGQSSHSWSMLLRHLKRNKCFTQTVCIYSYDCRGHGMTKAVGSDSLYNIQVLVEDSQNIVKALFSLLEGKSRFTRLVLCGHSLGGAVATHAASQTISLDRFKDDKGMKDKQFFGDSSCAILYGIVILDIVEGTAIDSLDYIKKEIESRPKSFVTVDSCIEYHLSNGIINSIESARVSIPSTIVYDKDIQQYIWRTDLIATCQSWHSWYHDLSSIFLSIKTRPKLLILSKIDRLDTLLTVAQMQGKYQLLLLNQLNVGHFVHEDAPEHIGSALLQFIARNCFT